jgi:hypothetical protein
MRKLSLWEENEEGVWLHDKFESLDVDKVRFTNFCPN